MKYPVIVMMMVLCCTGRSMAVVTGDKIVSVMLVSQTQTAIVDVFVPNSAYTVAEMATTVLQEVVSHTSLLPTVKPTVFRVEDLLPHCKLFTLASKEVMMLKPQSSTGNVLLPVYNDDVLGGMMVQQISPVSQDMCSKFKPVVEDTLCSSNTPVEDVLEDYPIGGIPNILNNNILNNNILNHNILSNSFDINNNGMTMGMTNLMRMVPMGIANKRELLGVPTNNVNLVNNGNSVYPQIMMYCPGVAPLETTSVIGDPIFDYNQTPVQDPSLTVFQVNEKGFPEYHKISSASLAISTKSPQITVGQVLEQLVIEGTIDQTYSAMCSVKALMVNYNVAFNEIMENNNNFYSPALAHNIWKQNPSGKLAFLKSLNVFANVHTSIKMKYLPVYLKGRLGLFCDDKVVGGMMTPLTPIQMSAPLTPIQISA